MRHGLRMDRRGLFHNFLSLHISFTEIETEPALVAANRLPIRSIETQPFIGRVWGRV